MKKLSKEKVEETLSNFGYKLLGPYLNGVALSFLECPKGHQYKSRISNFIHRNSRCPECDKEKTSKRCKIPWENLLVICKNKNFQLISSKEEYEKNHSKKRLKITIICRCGL